MWAQAVDLLARAERMHSRFFRLAASTRGPASWEPPADLFEDEREVVVVVAMPGVADENIEVVREPGAVTVRAQRPSPFAGSRFAVRQLEIPYGYFERRITLPAGEFDAATRELTHGCLILRLRRTETR
jgi:HSP20 family molecular chaperone IbpA